MIGPIRDLAHDLRTGTEDPYIWQIAELNKYRQEILSFFSLFYGANDEAAMFPARSVKGMPHTYQARNGICFQIVKGQVVSL